MFNDGARWRTVKGVYNIGKSTISMQQIPELQNIVLFLVCIKKDYA